MKVAADDLPLGIPKVIGRDVVGSGNAAGILFVAADGDVLLLRRSSKEANFAGHWALPGGGVEAGETPAEGAAREAKEEMGLSFDLETSGRLLDERRTPNGLVFHTFAFPTREKFVPKLNDEHTGYCWAPLNMLPGPIHPAVQRTIDERILGQGLETGLYDWATEEDQAQDSDWQRAVTVSLRMPKDKLLGLDAAGNVLVMLRQRIAAGATDQMAMDWLERVASVDPASRRTRARDDDRFAFDRASVRTYDADGRLHVARAHISKANICPYVGREIPRYQELGLDADKIYRLLRDPAELEKAAATFNNLPLLSEHVPVTAEDHQPELVVGSLGTDASFQEPFLDNSLVIWAKDAIDRIESGKQKEISCAYRYRADMTPGEYMGERYDGVMRDIVGNHAALVKEGRAGSDVVVGDSNQEISNMAKAKLSRTGVLITGALSAAMLPHLAQDAKLDLSALLSGVTAKNYGASKPKIVEGLKTGLKDKLKSGVAMDATIEQVTALLDKMDGEVSEGLDAEVEPAAAVDPNSALPVKEPAKDADPVALGKEFLRSKGMSEDDIADFEKAVSAKATDADPELKPKGAADEDDDDEEEKVDKKAMDAAIKIAADAARKEGAADAIRIANEIQAAREKVMPFVGKIAIACDSAEAVYRTAFKAMKIDVSGIKDPAAFPVMLDNLPKPGEGGHKTVVAMDSAAGANDFTERYPAASRIGIA